MEIEKFQQAYITLENYISKTVLETLIEVGINRIDVIMWVYVNYAQALFYDQKNKFYPITEESHPKFIQAIKDYVSNRLESDIPILRSEWGDIWG